MFYQRVQKANSETPVRQQNNRLFPRPSDNFKPLPAPTTPDGRINLSRLPTSDWMKNDPVLHRWAQEEAAAKSSDTPCVAPATDAAPPTAHDNETVNPELENLQVNSQTGVSPLPDGSPTEKAPRFQPILSRLPTSDWMKNDPVLQRWAQEEAAANSSKTPEISRSIQAKLTVSTPGDKYEQEADAMAAKVMAMPDRAIEPQQIASKQSNSTTAALQRAGQEDKTVSPELENRIQNATGGSPLPSEVRSFMENRFGVDFSAIEVHTDSAAAQMCKEVGAKAFAVGNRIYYGAGYAPGKNELTAHELTHTIQQGAAKRLNKQVWQLPEPQEMLVAKKINISPSHNNRQVYKFPREEAAPEPQKVEPTFNRVSRQIAVEELPSSTLQAKQFTNKAEPNFNKIQPLSAEKLSQTESLPAKSYLSLKTAESRPLSVSQTSPQIQGNWFKDRAVQGAIKTLETVLPRFGPIGKQVLEILRSAGNAFGTIASNPQAFLSNLVKAVQTGFQQFASRIGTHLKNGLIAWLTGALGSTVSMPANLDARGVVSLVLQVLGINYGRFRGLLANRIGKAKVERLEKGFDLVQRLARDGFPAAIQEMMQSAKSLETFQKTVVEGIRNWVIETVVKKAVAQLVKTFTGFGAIATAIEGIYKAISFLIEKASQIQALVNAVRDSIGNIAAGQIGTAASLIESALARSLSLTINFLAGLVGLGNVGERVRDIIKRVRDRVEAAVNRLVDLVVNQGNRWLATAGGGQSRVPANRPTGQPPNQGPPPATRQTSDGGLPETHVTYGRNGKKAGWVLAEPLTKLPGNTKGSRPNEDIPGWSYIVTMPQKERIFWEKVHLLSQKLHGPGESWNLVPARKTDNAWMRDNPEKTAKDLVNRNEILHYRVSVTYHNGTPEESNFPSQITVTYGQLRKKGDKYERLNSTTRSHSLEKPPSINKTHTFDLNSIGETTLVRDLGIPIAVARNILRERKDPPEGHGRFQNEEEFLSRMNNFYNNIRNPGHRANFQEEHWQQIKNLIKDGRLKI
jgi:hypothetical protein